ncbi:ORF1 [Lycalopex gymnocercus torque teno virus 1]|nr:ORF1 [Lycalopex gymnocercus torque teno virus 1]
MPPYRRLRSPWFTRRRWGLRKGFGRRYRRRYAMGYGRRRRWRKVRRLLPTRKYRKRQYITTVMQWTPKHRAKCTIHGWFIALSGGHTNTTSRANWTDYKPDQQKYQYVPGLGGTNIITLSILWLYWEWQHFRNVWSRSNKGFDMARYFGTTFKFWPHPKWDYIVWWDTEWPKTDILRDYWQIQPGIGLLQRQHKVVKSIKNGGKKPKRIRLKPPAVHDTKWYFQEKWCGVGLGHIGISLLNLEYPFLRKNQGEWGLRVGVKFTGEADDKLKAPGPTYWSNNIMTQPNVIYRWDMDDGEDNRIIVKEKNTDNTVDIVTLNYPYWVFFWGYKYTDIMNLAHKWDDKHKFGGHAAIWWWDYKGPTVDMDWKTAKKCWIHLYLNSGDDITLVGKNGLSAMIAIAQYGPFATSDHKVTSYDDANFQIQAEYKSYWQWGGSTAAQGETIDNPCPSNVQSRLLIENPATATSITLHPWDLDTSGLITKEKLREILGEKTSTYQEPREMETDHKERGGWDTEEEKDSDSETETSESDIENIEKIHRKTKDLAKRLKHERLRRRELRDRLLRLVE